MANNKEPEHNIEEEAAAAEDEDTGAQVAPIVRLEEVAVTTGEEDEEPLLDLKAKLYRFDKDGNQWKERGAGSVKLLKHKVTGKVRLVMRQSKTLKICANHLVLPTMTVQEHSGNEKSCVWHAPDFSDGERKDEMFCMRFASVENCRSFMEKVEEIAKSQNKAEENKEASEAAELLENLSVEETAPATASAASAAPAAASDASAAPAAPAAAASDTSAAPAATDDDVKEKESETEKKEPESST